MSTDETEVEWTVEGFLAEIDAMEANPPAAPEGILRIECEADPPHWPIYTAHVDGMYPAYCWFCQSAEYSKQIEELKHRSHHRWWKWRAYRWLARHGYSWGLTAGSSWGNMCSLCGTTTRINWRGKRSYILGQSREAWTCLLRYHHRRTPHEGCGLCTTCLPCPDCGSTATDHYDCGGAS